MVTRSIEYLAKDSKLASASAESMWLEPRTADIAFRMSLRSAPAAFSRARTSESSMRQVSRWSTERCESFWLWRSRSAAWSTARVRACRDRSVGAGCWLGSFSRALFALRSSGAVSSRAAFCRIESRKRSLSWKRASSRCSGWMDEWPNSRAVASPFPSVSELLRVNFCGSKVIL